MASDLTPIRLEYPPASLNPNARLHWAKKDSYRRTYKAIWFSQLHPHKARLQGQTEFTLSFAPPDKRIRDVDNCIASIKALIDALSVVVGIDDSQFKITFPREFMAPEKGGAIYLAIKGI